MSPLFLGQQGPASGRDDQLSELKRAWPKARLLLRLRGPKACKTFDQQASLHASNAVRFLRRRDLVQAELELQAALVAAQKSEGKRDTSALRSVLTRVRRGIYLPEYEAALEAASSATTRDATVFHLRRARRVAELLGNSEDVRWVDSMIEGPSLRPSGSTPTATSIAVGSSAEDSLAIRKSLAGPRPLSIKEQRAQFQRVANESRAYTSRRLKRRR
ncbi:MAG: hypothetical protein KGJ23_12875 [Euryarchaeota archaeon]|nr:hypothetical protein [Euryarchaeota archaeon]MDE2045541.1 hypothetical protein [Thermoplasmata archaeon]